MKKLCILLAFALALTVSPAFAAEGDAILGREEDNYTYFNYGFGVGDTLYMVSGGVALYTYRVGDAAMTERIIQLPDREADMSSDDLFPFACDGALYAIDLRTSYSEHAQFDGAELYALNDDGADGFTMEKVADLDWSEFVEYYDEDSYPTRPENVIGAAGKAFIRAYDNNGDYQLYVIDLATGAMERVSALDDAYCVTPYRDGMLLVEQYSYEQPSVAKLVAYDAASESAQLLAELEITDYNPLNALAYDPETDTLYCVKGGEICPVDMQSGEVSAGVTDMPLEIYNNASGFVLDGGYYALCSEGAVVRNLDPGQKAEIRLKICDGSYSDSVNTAYYRFANAHGDVSTVLSRDWQETQNLLENMMNRDDSIDIYVLSTSDSNYDALYNRGYLMELDGSEKLAALADAMYPDIREALSANGHLVAVPVEFYCWTEGINEKALAALGLSLDDVPDNWSDFLDFLAGLEEPLKAEPRVRLFYDGYTAKDARNDLFNTIFEDYQRYVNVVNPDMGYNTELLRGLLKKLEDIDFVALGCQPAEEDEGDAEGVGGYRVVTLDNSEESILFESGTGCTIGNFYSSFTPMLMGLDADTPMPLVLRTAVAFVNPFTRHPETALAFMEELADSLSTATRYNMDPSLNEVIRGAQNEENAADARKWVEDMRAQLESADPAEKQELEENLRDAEQSLEYWEEYGWEVSQRELDWYRGHDAHITVDRVNWLYADDSGEAWDLISRYYEGGISLEEMLSSIDRKVQMMRLEGN